MFIEEHLGVKNKLQLSDARSASVSSILVAVVSDSL